MGRPFDIPRGRVGFSSSLPCPYFLRKEDEEKEWITSDTGGPLALCAL